MCLWNTDVRGRMFHRGVDSSEKDGWELATRCLKAVGATAPFFLAPGCLSLRHGSDHTLVRLLGKFFQCTDSECHTSQVKWPKRLSPSAFSSRPLEYNLLKESSANLLLYKYLSLFWLILKVNVKVISEPALEYILVFSWTLNGPHRCGYSRQSRAFARKQ